MAQRPTVALNLEGEERSLRRLALVVLLFLEFIAQVRQHRPDGIESQSARGGVVGVNARAPVGGGGHDDRCAQSRPNDAAPQLASNKELHVALLLLSRATSNRLRSASTATGTHRQTAPGLNLKSNSYHSVLSDNPLAGRASTSPCSGMYVKS